jgi:isopentenyl diphosphate isomerase/L-lactate dehydrogenase-like FMN-dependent dehydrogenase
MRLDKAVNVEDFRGLARRRLPRLIFDVVDGGAGDESTMRANRAAFDELKLKPQPLGDVSEHDLGVTVWGDRLSLPVILGPCGAGQALHREAELGAARAAGAQGTAYVLSTAGSYQLEDVANAGSGPLWLGLYLGSTEKETNETVDRAQAAGYKALCLTVDGAVNGLRERDKRNGFADLKIRYTPGVILQGVTRPAWSLEFLRGSVGKGFRRGVGDPSPVSLEEARERIRHTWQPVTPKHVEAIRARWNGPLIIKGILRADRVEPLLQLGVDGIVVSNHGGRQLDGVPATIRVLPEVVEAARGEADVFVDGGIRRGTDVLRALALGAKACLVGRPYMYGLAAGGRAGVERVLEIFRGEIENALMLLGCGRIEDFDSSFVDLPSVKQPL